MHLLTALDDRSGVRSSSLMRTQPRLRTAKRIADGDSLEESSLQNKRIDIHCRLLTGIRGKRGGGTKVDSGPPDVHSK